MQRTTTLRSTVIAGFIQLVRPFGPAPVQYLPPLLTLRPSSFHGSLDKPMVLMADAVRKFFTTSMLMWIAPLAILYGFNHNMIPGLNNMSPYSQTILSGMLAVISVNIVIAFYICMAMKEPSDKHEPDPAFLAEAKASVKQFIAPVESEDSSQSREKRE